MKIIKQNTKTLVTRDNGRSSDAISPNFVYGCLGGCMKSYCYVGRYNHDKVYVNKNIDEILWSIENWQNTKPDTKIPNQVDPDYYTIDIGCSTDVPLMTKFYDWKKVFNYFNTTTKLKFTFATKYPSMFIPENYFIHPKNRIRVSLMPQKYSDILEPKTDKISTRIKEILRLQKHMEVHINFSPIIYTEGWLEEYRKLFQEIKDHNIDVKCECIFLTHNVFQHERNSPAVQELLWRPEIQEKKDSQYAADNIRYKWQLKKDMVNEFTNLYAEFFDPTNIRYIF